MDAKKLESSLQQAVSSSVRVLAEGGGRFRVFAPFMFDDGDHFAIVAKSEEGRWLFSDEGHTFMHLSYEVSTENLNKAPRAQIIADVMDVFGLREARGALVRPFNEDNMGAAFFAYVQALCKISDVSYLNRQASDKSKFREYCDQFFADFVPRERIKSDYTESGIDAKRLYSVDWRINGMGRPLYVFAVHNDRECQKTTITLHHFNKHDVVFDPVVIFDGQEKVGRQVHDRLVDIAGEPFLFLPLNYDTIKQHVLGKMGGV